MATVVDALPTANRVARPRPVSWLRSLADSYLFRKLLKTLLTIFVVITLIFFVIRLLPGNPLEQYVNQLVVQYGIPVNEARDRAASLFAIDLDQPLYLQYFVYLWNLLQGNLGNSILSPGTPVTAIILRFLPWTVFSVGVGLMISYVIGILLGLLMAYRRNSLLDHALTTVASVTSGVLPNYIV
ncbi:MAG: ABC transporter permease, partial [Chloroflexota bacterium]|nr:ABC transporter permease [Chloroflexota bacterium]